MATVKMRKRDRTIQKQKQLEDKKSGKKRKRATAKRTRVPTPEPEPEYFKDKRELEDLWKELFPVDKESDELDSVNEYNWNFENLENAFGESGALHEKRVYLFGYKEYQEKKKRVTHIPVVVAVELPFPPSDKIVIESAEQEKQEIITMKQMKMDWDPYISLDKRENQVERLKSEIYILRCNQRRTALKHLDEGRKEKFQHCLPYFCNPVQEDEDEQSTVVELKFSVDETDSVFCTYNWDVDIVEDITENLIKKRKLPADKKEEFMEKLTAKVKAQEKANNEAKDERQKAHANLTPEKRDAFENMKIYKFYPVATPDTPEIENRKLYINRYFGKAHELL